MKKLSNFLTLTIALSSFTGFSQITIQNYDFRMPVVPDTAELRLVGAGNSAVSAGANATWDLSSLFGGSEVSYYMDPVTSPNFPNAMAQRESPANIAGAVTLDQIYDFYSQDANRFEQVGYEIVGKAFSLGSVTGDVNDSVITLDTARHFSISLIEFPLNYGDTWSSQATIFIPMELTIESAAFYSEKFTIRQDLYVNDTVVGWGTLSLPSGAQADVLMIHSHTLRVDSAYWNGAPMDPIMSATLGITQNDTNRIDRYSFYTKGLNTVMYEYAVFNGTQGQPYYYKNNDIGVEEVNQTPVFLYPNPAGDRIHLSGVQVQTVQIADLSGRVILEKEVNSSEVTFDLGQLRPGYYVALMGDQSVKFVKE